MQTMTKALWLPLATMLVAGVSDPKQKPTGASDESAPDSDAAGLELAPKQVHTVTGGDTLWDLSKQYLGNPWYWPKVWSYNPEISNPHWIYPGNHIRFFPSGEEGPSRIEAGPVGESSSPDAIEVGNEPGVRVSGHIGYRAKGAIRIARPSFMTRGEVEEAGTIKASAGESLMLSYPQTVYVSFPKKDAVKVGDTYPIFRPGPEVIHPVTQVQYGHLIQVVGSLRVIRLSEGMATAEISPGTPDEVRRGDRVGPPGEQLVLTVAARPNPRLLKGYVIGAMVTYLTIFGEHQVLMIDQGSGQGVQPGNTFSVVRRHDPAVNVQAFLFPAKAIDPELPSEDVASCMVIDVKEGSSMCVLIRSMREVVYGDRVEMRPQEKRASIAAPLGRAREN
jgi:hypothetical protein